MIFVDDFTCFTWLFFLKRKSGVFSVFLHSKSLVGNKFNNKIKALSSDGGGEFLNHKIKAFCLNNGISHNLSYPYTPQQNGVVKRKHRQIVETSLAMLHKTNLPLSYWSYAFSTTVYLPLFSFFEAFSSNKFDPESRLCIFWVIHLFPKAISIWRSPLGNFIFPLIAFFMNLCFHPCQAWILCLLPLLHLFQLFILGW